MKRNLTLLVLLCLGCLNLLADPPEPLGPGWHAVQGTPMGPEARDQNQGVQGMGMMGLMSSPALIPAFDPVELTELSRGLKHNPALIFEHVRNHYDYVPYYGYLKGPFQTYLDRAGNDFDLAALTCKLLEEAGFNPQIVEGWMTIPRADLAAWLKADNNTAVINDILGDGSILFLDGSSYLVHRFWVSVEVGGNTQVFDPAFKRYQRIQGIDLGTAMGYDRADLKDAAGGSTGTGWATSLSESGIGTYLSGLATSLNATITGSYNNATYKEIVGGFEIVKESVSLPSSLPFSASTTQSFALDSIPSEFFHTVALQYGAIDEVLNISDVAGRRLAITYDTSETMGLMGSGEEEEEGGESGPGGLQPVESPTPEPVIAEVESEPVVNGEVPFDLVPDGEDPPFGILATTTVDFGAVSQTGAAEVGYTYTAPSNATLNLAVSVSGTNSANYRINDGGTLYTTRNYVIPANTSKTIVFHFRGNNASRGTKTAAFTVNKTATGYQPASDTFNATGYVGLLPNDYVSLTSVPYIQQEIGSPVVNPFTISEDHSTITMSVTNRTLTGSNQFEIASQQSLPRNTNWTAQVRYRATARGTHTATLTVEFTFDQVPYSASWTIQGITYGVLDLSAPGINFGQAYRNIPIDKPLTFKNNGAYSISITATSITGSNPSRFSIQSGGGSATVSANGGERNLQIRYLSSANGTHTANVRFNFTYDGASFFYEAPLAGVVGDFPRAKVWLDDTLLFEEPVGTPGAFGDKMLLSVEHPYFGVNANQDAEYSLKRGATYVIASDFGASRWGLGLKRAQQQLTRYRNAGLADTDREVLTATLDVMGRTWMQQTGQANDILQELAGCVLINHHRFGLVAQENGYYVDIKNDLVSNTSRSASHDYTDALFKSLSYYGSALEHGVLEQLQVERPAASTVKILFNANDNGTRVYLMNSGNVASLTGGVLDNYHSDDLADFNARVGQGEIFILPENGEIEVEEWKGKGYVGYNANPTSGNATFYMTIGGDYDLNGGYGGFPVNINTGWVAQNSFPNMFYGGETYHPISAEPVDLATGAYLFDSVDLELGQAEPRGIRFTRSYSSENVETETPLGHGWDHNWNSYISIYSEGDYGLGMRRAVDASPAIAALYSIFDLNLQTSETAKDWLLKAMVAKWGVDQLDDNAVAVHINGKVLVYCRQPDGSYTAPPGATVNLVKVGNTYELRERFGTVQTFTEIGDTYRLTSWRDVDGKELTVAWSSGRVATVTDCYNRTLTFSYTGERLAGVSDSTGRTISFGHNGNGDLTSFTGPDSHTFTYGYDGNHRITELRDPDNRIITQNFYNDLNLAWKQLSEGQFEWLFFFSGFRNVERDPQGGEKVYLFDANRLQVGFIDALGHASSTKLNGQQKPIETINPRGYLTGYEYDQRLNLLRVERETDSSPHVTEYVFDGQNRITSETDPRGNEVTHTYNAKHRRLTTTHVSPNETTTFTYDSDGNLETKTDPANRVTTYHYDQWGNISQIDYPGGITESSTFSQRGDLISLTDANGNTSAYQHNNRRLVTKITDPAPFLHEEVRQYDGFGNLAAVTDRRGFTTSWTFDPLGHAESMTNPFNKTTVYNWDSRDFRTGITTPMLHTSTTGYDAAGRVVSVTDPLNKTTDFDLDSNGNIVLETNPLSQEMEYGYDALDRQENMTNPRSETTSYDFDANGNRVGLTNARTATFTMQHDALNRQTHVTTPGNRTTATTFNSQGLVESVTEPSGQSASYVYDTAGRIQTKTDAVGTTTYTYDDNGNVLTVTEGGKTITRAYDELNRLTSYSDGDGNTISYTYDQAGNLATLTYPGGTKTVTYTYDKLNRINTVTDWSSRVTTYTYDDDGRCTLIERPNDTKRRMGYDAANRLTSIREEKADGSLIALYEFTHDAVGKITKVFSLPKGLQGTVPEITATYDLDNRIATVNSLTVTHDQDGNMTNGPLLAAALVSYTFDARNRLTAVDGTAYTYNAEGVRTSTTVSGNTTSFVVDPNGQLPRALVREKQPVGETTLYVYGAALLYEVNEQDEIISYHYNQVGSTVALVDETGNTVTDTFDYSPYAFLVTRTGTSDTPFMFNGVYGIQTDANGLLNMRARYYNPYLRRFINPDPIGFSGGMNWFAYADGNPLTYLDPFGLSVGAPGLGESLIPIWGSGRAAINDFQEGRWGWGIFNTALAVSDVFLVKSIVVGAGKFIIGSGAKTVAKTNVKLSVEVAESLAENSSREALTGIKPNWNGTQVRQTGNYFIKEVNPSGNALQQWYGKVTLNSQAEALAKLGDMAPSFAYNGGKLVIRDAGPQTGNALATYWKASQRLGTYFNDVRPPNMGSFGSVFDPIDPLNRVLFPSAALMATSYGDIYSYMTPRK